MSRESLYISSGSHVYKTKTLNLMLHDNQYYTRIDQGRIQTVATVAAATVRFPAMQTSLKSSISWNTVVLRIFFSEGIVSIHDLIHVDEMFCHSLRQLITRSLMLMAQSFFWLSIYWVWSDDHQSTGKDSWRLCAQYPLAIIRSSSCYYMTRTSSSVS